MVLTQYQKIESLRMHARGDTQTLIARRMKCSQSTISELIKKYMTYKTIDILPGRGRKKKTTPRMDRRMKLSVVRAKGVTTNHIKEELNHIGINVSKQHIRNRLHSQKLYGYIRRKVPMISDKNIKVRYAYAKEYRGYSINFWKNVMFVDEKKFELFQTHRRKFIWRRKNEAYSNGNTHPYTRSQSVMIWASFGANGVGDIAIVEGAMNQYVYRDLLRKHLRSSARKIGLKRGWMLLQDNDPKHTSKLVQSELNKMEIKTIKHPPQSPDMNPIENLFDYVENKLETKDRKSIPILKNSVIREWNNISPEICMKLAISMSDRIEEMFRMKGCATRY